MVGMWTRVELFSMAVAALSMAAIAYVLFLYPLGLALLARRRPRPVRAAPYTPAVSVIIPVRNGEPWLAGKLESVLALDYPRELLEIFVASDGSSDRTEDIARQFAGRGVRLLTLPRGGKPAALNAAIPQAAGEILLLTDVRQALARDCLKRLAACFADPQVGVVSGNLIIRKGGSSEEANTGLYWRYESWIRRNLSAVDSLLGATGPIYAMRRRLAVPIPPDCLLDDVYLPLAAIFQGYRSVLEEGAAAYDYPTALRSEFRRKVRTQGGIVQLIATYPGLLTRANRLRFHFVSSKIGRLALPHLLLLLLASSLGLPAPWRLCLLAGQAGFYGLGLIDPAIPEWLPLKRITAPVRTFLTLAAAAACALSVLFVSPRSLWKETQVTPV